MPFFSIIIPTYNRADFIYNTIHSVLNQTFQDFEILIVDNCSTDNTQEIVSKIDDSRIQFFINDQNFDRSYSRNRGIHLAKGNFITLLDSDDLMVKSCLQDAYDSILKYPSISLFHCDYMIQDIVTNKVLSTSSNHKQLFKLPIHNILYGNYISCNGVFVKNEILKSNLFDDTPIMIGSEDWDIWIRAVDKVEKIIHIPITNIILNEHPNRTMNQFNGEKLDKRTHYLMDKNLSIARKHKFENEFKSSCYLLIGNGYQESNDIPNALKYWKKAINEKFRFIFHFRALALLKNIILKSIINK